MTTKSKVPQIRFKGFLEEWEEKTINDLGDIITGFTPTTQDKSNYGGKYLFVSPADIQDNRYVKTTITTLSLKGHNQGRILEENSILFVSIGSTIGKVAQVIEKATTNQQINAIKPNKSYNCDIIYSLLLNKSQEIKKMASAQAVPIINKTNFSEIEVFIPQDMREQTKIGNYFQQLDKLIEKKEKKYQKLKQFKKAMLDKMFPKNGADTPEIRFKGFSGKWEETRLVEFSTLEHGDGDWILAQDITINGEYKIVQLGNIGLGKYIQKDLKTISLKTFQILRGTPIKRGDLLINRMVDGNVNSCIFKLDGNYITSVDVCWIRKNEYINNYFLMCLLTIEESQRKLLSLSSGSGRIRISKKNLFEKFNFLLPTIEEQTKIGNYFQKLDNQIDLQQKELEKLKNIKKASLAKMFV